MNGNIKDSQKDLSKDEEEIMKKLKDSLADIEFPSGVKLISPYTLHDQTDFMFLIELIF